MSSEYIGVAFSSTVSRSVASLSVPLPPSLPAVSSISRPLLYLPLASHCRAVRKAQTASDKRSLGRMFLLSTILLFGFASAQKVVQMRLCSIDEHHLRMDCKYALPPGASEPFCKYTNGERLFDTTDPDEEQHAPFRHRAKVRIFPGNICRLLYKNLPEGKSNFTCNIKYPDSGTTATNTLVVEKKLLLPCSAWSVLLQSCSGLLLTLMTLHMLLEIHWL